MTILKTFSEKEEHYHLYLSRLDKQRVEPTRQAELDEALAQAAPPRELLKKAGIDPDKSE